MFMKLNGIFFIAIISASLFNACKKNQDTVPASKSFESEVSYIITRTNTNEVQEVKSADVTAGFQISNYPVWVSPNETDIIFTIHPEVPDDVDVVSHFGFEFIFGVSPEILKYPGTGDAGPVTLVDPSDYTQLLLDDDEENGRRVCLTKSGTDSNGNLFSDNACASEGWYGSDGDFSFVITHHELFYNSDGQPNIYAEGIFEAETGEILNSEGTFKLSGGECKLVIPLTLP